MGKQSNHEYFVVVAISKKIVAVHFDYNDKKISLTHFKTQCV